MSEYICGPKILQSFPYNEYIFEIFLASPSSSRSLVVGWLVVPSFCWAVRPSVRELCERVTLRVSNGNFNLPTYLPMQQ